MWQKILWQIMKVGINAVPWTAIANELLEWVREKLKETDAITGDDLIDQIEEILKRVLGKDFDLNQNGI